MILRDEAFQKPVFFCDKTFLFDRFATWLKNNENVVSISNQLHIYQDGIYQVGYKAIETAMISQIPNLKKTQRREVLEYMELIADEKTQADGDLIKQVSAEQMLMIIEMGMMNLQTAIAQGVVSLPWTTGSDTTSSYAAATGSTASLGNGTGRAEKTTTYEGGVAKEYTVDGKTSVCWRGKENFWGNIWKFVYGINIWGNGKMGGGQPYICSDFSFAESKNSGNYEPAGFTVTNANGYISAMGYSTACDWLFIASECLGNSSLPVGDYTYITVNLNSYRIARLGGDWDNWDYAGGVCWGLYNGVGYRHRHIGGRLVYIPTRDSATYTAAIEAWKQKMAA